MGTQNYHFQESASPNVLIPLRFLFLFFVSGKITFCIPLFVQIDSAGSWKKLDPLSQAITPTSSRSWRYITNIVSTKITTSRPIRVPVRFQRQLVDHPFLRQIFYPGPNTKHFRFDRKFVPDTVGQNIFVIPTIRLIEFLVSIQRNFQSSIDKLPSRIFFLQVVIKQVH